MRKRKDLREWWLERLQILSGSGNTPSPQKLYEKFPTDFKQNIHKRGYWTIIKLAIHIYYLNLYLKIMRSEKQRGLFKRIAYVDTFAGPGIINVDNKHFFYGSPLLSILVPEEKFDSYIFIEKESKVCSVLTEVLDKLEQEGLLKNVKYQVIPRDMNDVHYSKELSEFNHALVFVDPEGVEPHFSTIQRIASLKCDLVLNYMDSMIRRIYDRTSILQRFFCGNLTGLEKPEDLFGRYLECIRKLRPEVKHINVKGLGSFGYRIIFAVRKTRHGNPWLKALDGLKERVEKTDMNTFKSILQQFTGEQSIILDQTPYQ